jgi:hypothetical protein
MSSTPVTVFPPQVTRIPIAGPDPYNTLVCCTFGGGNWTNGGAGFVTRGQAAMTSNFLLQGFDQRVPPQFEHSTSAWLALIGPSEDDTWLYAIDSIADAQFDSLGTFYVVVNWAVMYGHVPSQFQSGLIIYNYEALVCSYVLVYEPQVAPPPGGGQPGQGSTRFRRPQVTAPGLGRVGAVNTAQSLVNGISSVADQGPVGGGPAVVPSSAYAAAQGVGFRPRRGFASQVPSTQLVRCRCECDCCRKGKCVLQKCKTRGCNCTCGCCQP